MKNKKYDIPYCGVDIDKIKSAKPILRPDMLKKYRDYQYERSNIYYKKEILKESAPWTEDSILQKYSFTNVKREFDKESKILLNNVIYNPKCSLENSLLNSVFIRAYYTRAYILNNLDEGFIDFNNTSKDYKEYLIKKLPESIGNLAYLVSAYRRVAYREMKQEGANRVGIFFDFLLKYKDRIIESYLNIDNPIDVLKCNVPSLGSKFVTYQVLMDLGYHKDFKFSNNEFVFSGPGCSRGISFLCEDMGGLNDEEFMFWLRDNISSIIDFNPKEFLHFCDEDNQNWSVNDIENSFCEFSKYIKFQRMVTEGKRCKTRYYKGNQKRLEIDDTLSDF